MERSNRSPDDHIASLPDGVREDIATLDAVIADAMAGDERVLWEGCSGAVRTSASSGTARTATRAAAAATGEWFKVGLAAQKNYLSLYVNAAEDGQSLAKPYAPRLGKVKAGSANLQFKRAADVDLDVLRELVARARELIGSS